MKLYIRQTLFLKSAVILFITTVYKTLYKSTYTRKILHSLNNEKKKRGRENKESILWISSTRTQILQQVWRLNSAQRLRLRGLGKWFEPGLRPWIDYLREFRNDIERQDISRLQRYRNWNRIKELAGMVRSTRFVTGNLWYVN